MQPTRSVAALFAAFKPPLLVVALLFVQTAFALAVRADDAPASGAHASSDEPEQPPLTAAELAQLWRAYDERVRALSYTGAETFYPADASPDDAELLDKGRYAFAAGGRWLRDVQEYRTDPETGRREAVRSALDVCDGARLFRHAPDGGGAIRFDFAYPIGYTSIRQGLGRFLLYPERAPLPDRFLDAQSLTRLEDDDEGRPRIEALLPHWEGSNAGVWVRATLDPDADFAPRRIELIDRYGLCREVLITADDYRFVDDLPIPFVIERAVWRVSLFDTPERAQQFARLSKLARDEGLTKQRIQELGYDHPDVLDTMHRLIRHVYGDDGLPTRITGLGVTRFEVGRVLAVNEDVSERLFSHRYEEGARVWDEFTDRLYTIRNGLYVPTDPDTSEEDPDAAVAVPSMEQSP